MNAHRLVNKINASMLNEDNWGWVLSFIPQEWNRLLCEKGIVQRISRVDYSNEMILKALLIHSFSGKSLRETAAIMSLAYDKKISDVALYKRQKKSADFFKEMSILLMSYIKVVQTYPFSHGLNVRLIDGTIVKEPGDTGSLYRIIYTFCMNTFVADYIDVTSAKGKGNGESFKRIPVKPNDCIIGDRGYCQFQGLKHIIRNGGNVIVRYAHKNVNLYDLSGKPLNLLHILKTIRNSGESIDFPVLCSGTNPDDNIRLRLCAIKKTPEQYRKCIRKRNRQNSKKQCSTTEETMKLQKYVIVLTSLGDDFNRQEILDWYRVRWQVELCFKRMKSLMGLGALPKNNDASSIAWLYGKLFAALLIEKILNCLNSNSFSPWGFCLHASQS